MQGGDGGVTADYRRLVDLDGPGKFDRLCALLQAVAQHGSLNRAAGALHLSYRHAWGLVQQAEARLGAPLLIRRTGGVAGGGADLTAMARDLLARYSRLQEAGQRILAPGAGAEASPAPGAPDPDDHRTRPVLLASTIGPMEVGLLDALAAAYHRVSGVWVRPVAAGSGQALAIARAGRVDLVLTHAPALEAAFLSQGYGAARVPLMASDFLLCGPPADPAGVRGAPDAAAALRRIAAARAPFVSRGDGSGTHMKELELWTAAGVTPAAPWYRVYERGAQGSVATLRHAGAEQAYALADRATFAAAAPAGLAVLLAGGPELANTFALITLNPDRFPQANTAGAAAFVAWAAGPEGQAVIAGFGRAPDGHPLFQPAAPGGWQEGGPVLPNRA